VKPAEATFPGTNGRIAYYGFDGNDNEIYTINSDGGDKFQVTQNDMFDRDPSYSPDGSRIAYVGYDGNDLEIRTVNVNGGASLKSPTIVRTTTILPTRPMGSGSPM
jgi:Tol biopolymer transport system component